MQSFRTTLAVQKAAFSLTYQEKTLSLGSCFAANIGERLQKYKIPIQNNPFGIVYNPVSVLKSLKILLSSRLYTEGDLFESDGLWHSFDHHGQFSHPEPEIALKGVNTSLRRARAHFAKCEALLLTFGTAFVFEYKKEKSIVANCHKVPADAFRRYRLETPQIAVPWIEFLKNLEKDRPNLKVILSVSPVRHLRDGLVENQRSKATLLLAAEQISRALDFVHYFPAYELLLDDLRDYRFYGRDLNHPNEMAIDYIWNFFLETYFDLQTQVILKEVQKIRSARDHRPLHPGAAAHRQFARRQLEKIERLQKKYSFLDFEEEKEYFAGF